MFYENLIDDSKMKVLKNAIKSFKNNIDCNLDDDCLNITDGKVAFNFYMNSGVLTDGLGINDVIFRYNTQMYREEKKVNFPENYQVMGCWCFPYYDTIAKCDNPALIVYCSNRKFYFLYIQNPETDIKEIPNLTFEDVPVVVTSKINGVDNLIMVSNADGMYTWNPINGANKIDNAPIITSMCSQYDRLFVTSSVDKKAIFYSESLNPTNFNILNNEGGIITLYDDFGNCNKVISFKGFVYIFRDYNIAKITAYGDDDEFVVSQLHVGNGKIFANTICACGDKIIYLASDGLYSFDGNKSIKIDITINNLINGNENELAKGNYSNGSYYLSCRMNFKDNNLEGCENRKYVNNALIKIDLSNYEFTILRGYDIQDIIVINDSIDTYVLVIYHDGVGLKCGMLDMSGSFFGIPTHKVWRSAKSDFGYNENKIIKEISFESSTAGKLKIFYDDKVKEFLFGGGNTLEIIKPLIKCRKFSIEFDVNSNNSKVSKPTIKVGVIC